MPPQRRGAPRGDHTGRQREVLAQQAAVEIAEREDEISMITHAAQVRDEKGIFDAQNQQMVDADEDYNPAEDTIEYVDEDSVEDLTSPTRPVDAQPHRMLVIEEVEDLGPPVEVAPERSVVIRVSETLEDVTIGYGNNYTFLEGRRYRVPQHVAVHLEEKGLVLHSWR